MFPIPTVPTAQELVDRALRRAAKATGKGQNRLERARRASVAKIQTVGDTIGTTLKKYVEAVPSLERLPEFQRELVDLLVGVGTLKHDLGAIDWCRDQVVRICRQGARAAGRAKDPTEATRTRKAVYGRVSSLVNQIAPNLLSLAKARGHLVRVPDIDTEMPTIVVAGYPNVGKSQFVRAVSTGKPKVAPYPFTTQGLGVGHLERRHRRYLVVDTPGLLDRPMAERNAVERQAVLALRHLADAIVFLFDPTETCGAPMEIQERLLAEIREAFPTAMIFEIENKGDLEMPARPNKTVEASMKPSSTSRRRVSALTGEGCTEFMETALAAITSRVPEGAPPLRVD